jgi:hypothetical protein
LAPRLTRELQLSLETGEPSPKAGEPSPQEWEHARRRALFFTSAEPGNRGFLAKLP